MEHDHSHGSSASEYRLKLSVFLTMAFVLGEATAGWFSNSLALMSDAGHNFADALALGFSWYAIAAARKRSTSKMTFGFHRVGILAALVNAVSLVVIALFISWEAVQRLSKSEEVRCGLMIGIASVAVFVNVVISLWLHGGKENLNVRSAYIHMIGDAVSAVGVVIAGVVVAFTKSTLADPLVSFLIAALIIWSSWGILKESVNVLLEGTPEGLDMNAVASSVKKISGVINIHDLHVWTVGPGAIACSCHILVSEQSMRGGQQILKLVVEELEHRFNINHTTVQVEVEGCSPNELYCNIRPENENAPHHHH